MPALVPNRAGCCLSPLSTVYFAAPSSSSRRALSFIDRAPIRALCVDLLTTILVLVVTYYGCAGVDLDHLLRRLHVVRIRGLVKTALHGVHLRLFKSTFLAIILTFNLSVLLIGSYLSLFGSLLNSQLAVAFFFDDRVLP